MSDPDLTPVQRLITDYFGLWVMRESHMRALADHVNAMDVIAHVRSTQEAKEAQDLDAAGEPQALEGRRGFALRGGVAIIPISGMMMKRPSSLDDATGTVMVRRQIRAAAQDPDAESILLAIDSPGGAVAGTQDLADEVTKARKSKPVVAYIEDMGASAAYWVASQAERIYANSTAQIGSIGVFAVAIDSSQLAEAEGIKVHVLRTGDFKGGGVDGAPISDEQLAEWQRTVDGVFGKFVEAVATGRPDLDRAKLDGYADGRTWLADEAATMGLIDGVRPFDSVMAEMRSENQERRQQAMTDKKASETPVPQPATFDELTAVCAGADSEFICEAQRKRMTLEQAREAWMTALADRAKAAEEKAEAAEAKAEEAEQRATVGVGVDPVETTATEDGDNPTEAFDQLVRQEMAAGSDRIAAIQTVATRKPDLHHAFLLATNNKLGRRLLTSKAEAFGRE